MGSSNTKEIRNIYIHDTQKDELYPIIWPDTFEEFIEIIHEIFPSTTKIKSKKFIFQDSCERKVTVVSERTFKALVPKHKNISPELNLYYVTLEEWVI